MARGVPILRGVKRYFRSRVSCCGSRPGRVAAGLRPLRAGLCLRDGLNQTNMDNRFAFGLWIFLDLTVIALGAGAFFTGFLSTS